jgi:hypothetical protein
MHIAHHPRFVSRISRPTGSAYCRQDINAWLNRM